MDFKRAFHGKIVFLELKNRLGFFFADFQSVYASLIT